MEETSITFDTAKYKYYVTFSDVSISKGFIQDLYTGGKQTIPLFSSVNKNKKYSFFFIKIW